MEAMEALAAEVERRARKAGKGVVLILAGGLTASPPPGVHASLDAVPPAPAVLPDPPRGRGGAAGGPDGGERGFTLADGLVDDRSSSRTSPRRRDARIPCDATRTSRGASSRRPSTADGRAYPGHHRKGHPHPASLGDFLGEADSSRRRRL